MTTSRIEEMVEHIVHKAEDEFDTGDYRLFYVNILKTEITKALTEAHQAGIDEDDTLYPKITLNTLAKIIGGSLHKRLNAIKVDEEVAQMEKLLKQHGISVPDRVCLILNRKEFINFIKETLQDNN